MVTENGATAGVETPANRLPEAPAAKPKKKAIGRGMLLFGVARKGGDPKKSKTKGFVITTDMGEVDVTLVTFPDALSDEAYTEAAEGSGLQIKFDLEGMKLAGIHLTSATTKVVGENALDFLETVQDTDEE